MDAADNRTRDQAGANRPIEAIVFDLDGTLLDHGGSVTAALDRWLPTVGTEGSDALRLAWFDAEERHFDSWRRGEISFAEQRRRRLREVLPSVVLADAPDREVDALFEDYVRHYEAAWRAYDDVGAALAAARSRGLTVAILTNGTEEQQASKVSAIGLTSGVAGVFTSETLGHAKPDGQAFRAVCSRLGLDASAVLHVGDNYELDVVAPRSAGLRALHLDRGGHAVQEKTERISSLTESDGYLAAVLA